MQADRFTVKSQEAVAAAQRLAARARATPRSRRRTCCSRVLEQEDGLAPAVLRKLSADVAAITERARGAVAELPTVSGEDEPEVRPAQSFISGAAARREGDGRRSATSTSPSSTSCSRSPTSRPASPTSPRPRLAAQGGRRGPRPAPGHLAQPRGDDARRWRSSAAT